MSTGANPRGGIPARARALLVTLSKPLRGSKMWRLWRARDLHRRTAGPLEGVQNEWSVISAPPANEAPPSEELVRLALTAIELAYKVELETIKERRPRDLARVMRMPGQHYRLLAGLAQAWNARRVIEIGTYTGVSALCLLEAPSVERLVTYDLVPWNAIGETYLRESDFGERFGQKLIDLSDPKSFATERDELLSADLIFLDASKDGAFEERFLRALFAHEPRVPQLIVMDDIRVLTMIRVWRDIPYDKLDLCSFGHWSGTGVVARGLPDSTH